MSNDHASAELPSESDHPTADAGNRSQLRSGRHKKITGTLLRGWRALAFLLIVVIIGFYAFHYKALSDPGSENEHLADAPLEIYFLVSNPSTFLDVSATAGTPRFPDVPGIPVYYVSVTVHPPPKVKNATILMITNIDSSGGSCPLSQLEAGSAVIKAVTGPGPGRPSWPVSQVLRDLTQEMNGDFACALDLPPGGNLLSVFDIGYLQRTNAHLYGHLPAIGTIDQQFASRLDLQAPPAVLAESYKNVPDEIRDIVFRQMFPDAESALSLKSYSTPYGGPGELFWPPAKLSITETALGLAAAIGNQEINYMTPTGQASGSDYVWQGSALDPIFEATNDDALEKESNLAFLSGVLFGIAGAAAIAFVQEIPETFSKPVWWSRRKQKRKSSSRNAAI